MRIVFDPNKSRKNERERNLPFEFAELLDWDTANIELDNRYAYPEPRLVAYGYLFGRLHICCFTPVDDGIRVISFRKANKREVKHYEAETADR